MSTTDRQAKPHPQAPAQRAAGESLQRLDGPEKARALVRARRHASRRSPKTDARVGGRYRIVVRSPDGDEHDVSGVFREVMPDEKLVFTWAWRSTPERESLVTVELKPDGDGTLADAIARAVLRRAARDRHQAGWSAECSTSLAQELPVL